jgi:hypothetical protein
MSVIAQITAAALAGILLVLSKHKNARIGGTLGFVAGTLMGYLATIPEIASGLLGAVLGYAVSGRLKSVGGRIAASTLLLFFTILPRDVYVMPLVLMGIGVWAGSKLGKWGAEEGGGILAALIVWVMGYTESGYTLTTFFAAALIAKLLVERCKCADRFLN